MNFNLFDDMDGLILRERENSMNQQGIMQRNDNSRNAMNGMTERFPQNTPIGMAYVPFQQWGEVYSEDEAFENGTLFPELNFPFERGADRNE